MPYTIKFNTNSLNLGGNDVGASFEFATDIANINAKQLFVENRLTLPYLNPGFLLVDSTGVVTSRSLDNITISNLHLSGISDAPTASLGTATNQIATTLFVKNACDAIIDGAIPQLNTLKELAVAIGNDADFITNITATADSKVSLTGEESISGVKTFEDTPIFSSLSNTGIVHNDELGNLSTTLIQTDDIDEGVITGNKMDVDLVLPANTVLDTTTTNDSDSALVVKGFLTNRIKTFTDILSNDQPVSYNSFFHVTSENATYDNVLQKNVFQLQNNIRHVIEIPSKIILPPITLEMEGISYFLVNKSGGIIQISTSSVTELIFNSFVAPDGDNDFDLDLHQCLEFVCISTNSSTFWQAYFY
jgi:hypothetical protein